MSDWRDLLERLDDLEDRFGLRESSALFIVNASPTLDDHLAPYTITQEWPDDPMIDGTERVEIPVFTPITLHGVQCLDANGVRRLWEIQPEDVREQELDYRIKHGEPIPPVLQE